MQLLQCTQKLLQQLDRKPTQNVQPLKTTLGGWHANMFFMDRRKCVLVTNDSTLFTLFIPYLTKKDFQSFELVFLRHLLQTLLSESVMQREINMILKEHERLIFTRTTSRSVLGSMNDQKNQVLTRVYIRGGLKNISAIEMNKKLNRNILSAINYKQPVEMLRKTLVNKA